MAQWIMASIYYNLADGTLSQPAERLFAGFFASSGGDGPLGHGTLLGPVLGVAPAPPPPPGYQHRRGHRTGHWAAFPGTGSGHLPGAGDNCAGLPYSWRSGATDGVAPGAVVFN